MLPRCVAYSTAHFGWFCFSFLELEDIYICTNKTKSRVTNILFLDFSGTLCNENLTRNLVSRSWWSNFFDDFRSLGLFFRPYLSYIYLNKRLTHWCLFYWRNLAPGGGGGRALVRSPSAIKQMLLDWTKAMTQEYEVTHDCMTSWKRVVVHELLTCSGGLSWLQSTYHN